jgi:hypothetical protein
MKLAQFSGVANTLPKGVLAWSEQTKCSVTFHASGLLLDSVANGFPDDFLANEFFPVSALSRL